MNLSRKFVFSVTSWFKLPQLGMDDYEMMCRGSCFGIPALSPRSIYQNHFFTSFHVVAPYLFKKFYPEEKYNWTKHVTERDVVVTMEIRDEYTGEKLLGFGVDRKLLAHSHLDLCCIHLNREAENLNMIEENGYEIGTFQLDIDNRPETGTPVTILGNQAVDQEDGPKEGIMIPRVEHGEFLYGKEPHFFVQTNERIALGMAGGPIVTDNGKCLGMVEGIIDPFNKYHPEHEIAMKAMENSTLAVDAKTLADFAVAIESGSYSTPDQDRSRYHPSHRDPSIK